MLAFIFQMWDLYSRRRISEKVDIWVSSSSNFEFLFESAFSHFLDFFTSFFFRLSAAFCTEWHFFDLVLMENSAFKF